MTGIVVTNNISTSAITDTYATHLALLGKGGHRTVDTVNTDLDGFNNPLISLYSLPTLRREFGMIVAVINDPDSNNNNAWILANGSMGGVDLDVSNNNNWVKTKLLSPNSGSIFNDVITGQTITININEQYLIYGDLILNGTIINNGTLTILNGEIILGTNGVFTNNGQLELVDLSNNGTKFKSAFNFNTVGTPLLITHNLNSLDLIINIRDNNTPSNEIFMDVLRINNNQIQINPNTNIIGIISIIKI